MNPCRGLKPLLFLAGLALPLLVAASTPGLAGNSARGKASSQKPRHIESRPAGTTKPGGQALPAPDLADKSRSQPPATSLPVRAARPEGKLPVGVHESTAPRVSLPPPVGSEMPALNGARIRATGAYQREYWYWYERSRPSGIFPKGAEFRARQEAFAHRQRFQARLRSLTGAARVQARASFLNGTPWDELGPRGAVPQDYGPGITSGRIMSLIVQPASNRIVVGSASGGIWRRSMSLGAVFAPQSDSAPNPSIGALAVDPTNPNILYAGTGEPGVSIDSYDGAGVLKSTNGGTSWTRIDNGIFTATKISGLWVDPSNSSRLLASTLFNGGLYESVNGGVAWTLKQAGSVMGFAVSPTDHDRILLSRSDPWGAATNDLMLSTNGGASFTALDGPWQSAGVTVGRIDVAFAPSQPTTVWASVAPPIIGSDGGKAGIYRSTDSGATFTGVFLGNPQGAGWYSNPISVSPADPNVFYAGGVDLYRGVFGGSIKQITHWFDGTGVPYIHADQHVIVFDPTTPNTVYVGNDGGLFVSKDDGATWSDMNAGLATVQFYYGTVGPNNGLSSLFGGTQDNGSLRPTNGLEWTETLGGDGFQCVTDPQNNNIVYGSVYNSDYYLSTDFGASFLQLPAPPFLGGESRPFVSPLAIDPSDGTKLYGGAERVYQGISNRVNSVAWTALSNSALFPGEQIRRIAVAKTDGKVIYASGGAQMARTTAGGGAWTNATPPGGQFITGIAVHPTNADTVFCTRSGFTNGHVLRSTDGGANWVDITSNLPNVPVNNLAIRAVDGRLDTYLATDTGVYYADLNLGAVDWSPVGSGLPNVYVFDVLLAENGDKLIAVTHGRGMWVLPLTTPPLGTPLNLTAAPLSSTSIQVDWADNSTTEQGFKLERATNATFTTGLTVINVAAKAGSGGKVSYPNAGLLPNTTYYYRARAYSGATNSAYSNAASAKTFPTPPAAPTVLTATTKSSSRIDLAWQDKSNNELGFKIERRQGAGGYTQIGTTKAGVATYSDTTGLAPDTAYTYQVRAYNDGGNSAYSNQAPATTLPNAPTVPGTLTAFAVSDTSIQLDWVDTSNNEQGFRLERKLAGAAGFTLLTSPAAGAKTYTDSTLTANTVATYRIRAYNRGGESGNSNEASTKTLAKLGGTLVVTPSKINFKAVKRRKSKTAFVTIRNASGIERLRVTVPLPAAPFGLQPAVGTVDLAPSATLRVGVVFGPLKKKPYSGKLIITSSDLKKRSATVKLTGSGK